MSNDEKVVIPAITLVRKRAARRYAAADKKARERRATFGQVGFLAEELVTKNKLERANKETTVADEAERE